MSDNQSDNSDEWGIAQPPIDGFGGNLDEMFDAPAVPLTDEQIVKLKAIGMDRLRAWIDKAKVRGE